METPRAGDPLYFLLPKPNYAPMRAEKAGRVREVLNSRQDGSFTVTRRTLYGGPGDGTWVVRRFPQGDRYSNYDSKCTWIADLADASNLPPEPPGGQSWLTKIQEASRKAVTQ
jgi:hypothetical protein